MSSVSPLDQEVLGDRSDTAITTKSCLIISDDEFEREGLQGLLSNRGMKLIQSVSFGEMSVDSASSYMPDIVIADTGPMAECPVEILESIRDYASSSRIILLCNTGWIRTHLKTVQALSEVSQAGFTLRLRSNLRDGDRMASTIGEVLDGNHSIDSDMIELLIQNQSRRTVSLTDVLTTREIEILQLIAVGHANSSIASRLNLSKAYIGNALTRIFIKLGIEQNSDMNLRVLACREWLAEFGMDAPSGSSRITGSSHSVSEE